MPFKTEFTQHCCSISLNFTKNRHHLSTRTRRKNRTQITILTGQVHGSAHACLFIKMLFFCCDMLYRLCKQHGHVIMMSKNQSVHSPGSHLIKLCANNCKLINHQRWQCWHNPLIFSAILVLLHPTSGYSEKHFYSKIHSEIAEINVSGIANRQN